MSSKRNTLKIKSRVKKMYYSPYQASDAEIQSDLKRLKYISSKDKVQNPSESKEKIKRTEDEGLSDSNAIEMLMKLQTFREADKKQETRNILNEKKIVSSESRNCYNGHIENPWNYDINYQNYLSNMMLMSNFNMLQCYQMSLNQGNSAFFNFS